MNEKIKPTPFDQRLFLIFIVTFATMTVFEFAGQFLYPYPPDWRSNLITSLFASGLAVIVAYFPLSAYYAESGQLFSEIERRHLVETELRESESRLSSIIRVAPIGICLISNRIIRMVNDQLCTITGYTAGELTGTSTRILYAAQEDYDAVGREICAQIAQTGSGEIETRWRRKDGAIIDVLLSSTPVDPSDISSGLTFTALDITEQKRAEMVLRESENKFATVFRTSPVALSLISVTEGTFVDVNDAFVRNTGYSRDEVIGIKAEVLGLVADKNDLERMISLLRDQRGVSGMEVRCRIKNGEIRTCMFSSSITLMGGKPYVLSSVVDITEDKAMESAYQTLVRSMVGTTGLNSLQKITENVRSWLGADCVMVGEIQPDNQTVKVLSMSLDGKEVTDFSYTLKGTPCENVVKNGFFLCPDNAIPLFPESRDLAMLNIRGYAGTTLRNSGGQVLGLLCALFRNPIRQFPSMREIIDIIAVKAGAEIERTHMERALRESEEKFRMVVENSLDGILIVSMTGEVLYRNRSLENIFDTGGGTYRPGTKNVMEFISPESRSQVLHDFGQVAQGIDSYPMTYQAITATGRQIWIESIGKRIQFQNSPAILISMKDISSRKRMEDAILRANKKLNLLSGITRHDIDNQLQALNGYIELLHMKVPDPLFENYFSHITEASSRITAMIRFTKEYEEIGVRASLWQDLQMVVKSAGNNASLVQVVLNNNIPADTEVFADPLIVKVFFNLIDNALRHGGRITTIRFSFEVRNGVGIIVCEDDGNGVPEENKEKIFTRGFGKNTGLGLAISREILDITGITIKETGVPGRGARFEIVVPKEAYRVASPVEE
jgi:PAS domain S-box-containing protein